MNGLQADAKQKVAQTKLILLTTNKSLLLERKKPAITCDNADGAQHLPKQESSSIEKYSGFKQHNKIPSDNLVENQRSSSLTLNNSKIISKKEQTLMSQFNENFAKLGCSSSNMSTIAKAFSTPQSPSSLPRKTFQYRNSSESKASSDGSVASYKWQPNNGQKYKIIKLESMKRIVVEDMTMAETMGEFQAKLTVSNALPLQPLKLKRLCLVLWNGTVNRARIIGIDDEQQSVLVQYVDKYGIDHIPFDR